MSDVYYFGTYGSEGFNPSALSVAGQLAQNGLVNNIKNELKEIYCYVPNRIFPLGSKLYVSSKKNNDVTSLFYLNLPLLRWVTLFFSVLYHSLLIPKGANIIAYNCYYPSVLPILIARLFKGFKVSTIAYDIHIPGNTVKNSIGNWIQYYLVRFCLKRSDKVIAINRKIVDDFNLDKNSLIIHGGVERVFPPSLPVITKHNVIKVGFAGRLDRDNGIKEILNVAQNNINPHVEFYIAGTGELVEDVRRSQNINYLGELPHQSCIDFLKSMDILLCIRVRNEVDTRYFFPSKFYEYLSIGKPVISTKLPLDDEELDRVCFVVEENANSITCVLDDFLSGKLDLTVLNNSHEYIKSKVWVNQANRIMCFVRGDKYGC